MQKNDIVVEMNNFDELKKYLKIALRNIFYMHTLHSRRRIFNNCLFAILSFIVSVGITVTAPIQVMPACTGILISCKIIYDHVCFEKNGLLLCMGAVNFLIWTMIYMNDMFTSQMPPAKIMYPILTVVTMGFSYFLLQKTRPHRDALKNLDENYKDAVTALDRCKNVEEIINLKIALKEGIHIQLMETTGNKKLT